MNLTDSKSRYRRTDERKGPKFRVGDIVRLNKKTGNVIRNGRKLEEQLCFIDEVLTHDKTQLCNTVYYGLV